ncbi:hypothetical protein AZE42_10818, partial [Rhizopogon vesiculosus]
MLESSSIMACTGMKTVAPPFTSVLVLFRTRVGHNIQSRRALRYKSNKQFKLRRTTQTDSASLVWSELLPPVGKHIAGLPVSSVENGRERARRRREKGSI